MAEFKKLKTYFDGVLAALLAEKIRLHYPAFDTREFIRDIESKIDKQELKQRVKSISDALYRQLPANYKDALDILRKILGPENENETGMFTQGYWLMPLAFFVEKYGGDHFDESVQFIEEITKRNTGEYAIRPFLQAQPEKTLKVALKWSNDENNHVRRLASEGLRPRLPWAKKITLFSQDPSPVIAVLENLKSDSSAYVRKSVANHLADFLKENYSYTINLLKQWRINATPETRWIIKHALRNEIKYGNTEALKLIE
jgi:3-methyladenine DNA glycosylase AlkC